jgi:hypothetical protein
MANHTKVKMTASVRNFDGSVIYSTHDSIEEALDARTGGETVWNDSEGRELTEDEIFAEEKMTSYTYTIFDAPPSSGPCAWPSHDDVQIDSESPESALRAALDQAEIHGDSCGEYEPGHVLHVLVWDESGQIVADGAYRVQAAEL